MADRFAGALSSRPVRQPVAAPFSPHCTANGRKLVKQSFDPHTPIQNPNILGKVGRITTAQRVARFVAVVEIHAARFLQIQILRRQIRQHARNDVEREQRLDGDVVADAAQPIADRSARAKAVGILAGGRTGNGDRRSLGRHHHRLHRVVVHRRFGSCTVYYVSDNDDDEDDADVNCWTRRAHKYCAISTRWTCSMCMHILVCVHYYYTHTHSHVLVRERCQSNTMMRNTRKSATVVPHKSRSAHQGCAMCNA